ncbi:unnamed protein product, partial [Angiostrongylus costaricensis]|uniref:SynN domain-containing protein n=1 Tax=Angiostrongylus costaricensis TaxID=334426 RepID=A0A0R3P9Q6_ANGCS
IRGLTRALYDVLWKFNEEEEIYKERCRKKITDYLRIHISLTDEEISDAIDNGDIFERTKGILLAYNDRKALFEDVKLRRDELFEIEKVIRELGEMFLDLNNLVLSQASLYIRFMYVLHSVKEAMMAKILTCILIVAFVLIILLLIQSMLCHFTPIC